MNSVLWIYGWRWGLQRISSAACKTASWTAAKILQVLSSQPEFLLGTTWPWIPRQRNVHAFWDFFPLFFCFFWSGLHWAKSGARKKATHTLDLKCRVQACMGRSAGLFVVDSAGDSVHVWVDLLEEEYADFRYFQETCYGPSAPGSLKETLLFKPRVPDRAKNIASTRQNSLLKKVVFLACRIADSWMYFLFYYLLQDVVHRAYLWLCARILVF